MKIIDASQHQGKLTLTKENTKLWNEVAQFSPRASYGTYSGNVYIDRQLNDYYKKLRPIVEKIVPYHYFSTNLDWQEQAKMFLEAIKGKRINGFAIDVESTELKLDNGVFVYDNLLDDDAYKNAELMLRYIEDKTGLIGELYCNASTYRDMGSEGMEWHYFTPLWLAYPTDPNNIPDFETVAGDRNEDGLSISGKFSIGRVPEKLQWTFRANGRAYGFESAHLDMSMWLGTTAQYHIMYDQETKESNITALQGAFERRFGNPARILLDGVTQSLPRPTKSEKPLSFIWPTEYIYVTQPFGANEAIYKQWGLPGHEGIDMKALHGTKIFACADGVVYSNEGMHEGSSYIDPESGKRVWRSNYGRQVRIQHKQDIKTIYAHLDRAIVENGQKVKAGQLIGYADNTGNSFGSHLHLTVKKKDATKNQETRFPGDIVDPTPYLGDYIENKV